MMFLGEGILKLQKMYWIAWNFSYYNMMKLNWVFIKFTLKLQNCNRIFIKFIIKSRNCNKIFSYM